MKKEEILILIDGLKKLSADAAEIAAQLGGSEAMTKKQDIPDNEGPAKTCTLEEARIILAEKARLGYRAEVKAILTAHGVKRLSDITDPEEFAAIAAEAEVVGDA